MRRDERALLKQALHDVLVAADGELDALEAFRRIKELTGDERAPMLMCLEAGCRADDVLMLERPGGESISTEHTEKAPLTLIDKTANLAVLDGGTGSEHVAAALQQKMTLQERCEHQPKTPSSEWDYLRRFDHTPRYATDGNGGNHE